MKNCVATFPTRGGPFITTHWSVLRDLSKEKEPEGPERTQELLAKLCEDYWPPIYRFVRFRGYSKHDAQDLTQGFFVFLLEKEAYKLPEPGSGQFRTFLLFLLKRYLKATDRYRHRQKRGGGSSPLLLDEARLEALEASGEEVFLIGAPLDEQRAFDCDWAAALVERAMAALQLAYSTGPRARVFDLLRPFLSGGIDLPTHEEVAAQLAVPMETLRSHLFRLRSTYRALLRAEVARTVPNEAEVESELRYLCRILIASV